MKKPRGKIPSLLSGTSGKVHIVKAKKKSKCKRCSNDISTGEKCFDINSTGTFGQKRYCIDCFRSILEQTTEELNKLYAHLN